MIMRKQMCYYRVEATKDGIVVFVYPSRKPRKSSHDAKPRIDEDGIYTWWTVADDRSYLNDIGKGVFQSVLATAINTKRIVREIILPRLQHMEERADKVMEQIERIEGKLDRLLASIRRPS